MKSLIKYLNEKLIINQRFDEKLIINKNYKSPYTCAPISWDELRKIIDDRYKKLGPGTKQNPIDFSDVDVSNIDSFYNDNTDKGIFDSTKFKYIDISYWNVSNIKNMSYMFYDCKRLETVGDLSKWNVSNVENMRCMFFDCKQLKSVGDLSNWDVSKVKNVNCMFGGCTEKIIPYWYYKL